MCLCKFFEAIIIFTLCCHVHHRNCSVILFTISFAVHIILQSKALSVIGGVNAVASKLHELIADLCTPTYSGLCSAFRSAPDIGSLLSAKLTNITKTNGFGISNGEGTTNIVFYVYSQNWQQVKEIELKALFSFNKHEHSIQSYTPD